MSSFVRRTGAGVAGVVVILWVLSLPACNPLGPQRPPLPDSTFRQVLVDLHLTTARSRLETAFPQDLPDSVLTRHGVHLEDVEASLRYYSERPGAFASLYNGVIDTLRAIREQHSRHSESSSVSDPEQRAAE